VQDRVGLFNVVPLLLKLYLYFSKYLWRAFTTVCFSVVFCMLLSILSSLLFWLIVWRGNTTKYKQKKSNNYKSKQKLEKRKKNSWWTRRRLKDRDTNLVLHGGTDAAEVVDRATDGVNARVNLGVFLAQFREACRRVLVQRLQYNRIEGTQQTHTSERKRKNDESEKHNN
jgi:hypothetical protein